ncbi:MAG: nucleoside hydrolase, partial [Kiritimatiellaeota bacterium]|nr:nucleoside hydrolase [Kiritimatiellota bacterium]
GNDIDDLMALALIHTLETRGHCRLIAVTSTKDHPLSIPFCDAANTFYGKRVPLGAVRNGVTKDQGKYLGLVSETDDGAPRYPHTVKSGEDAPDAVSVLRKVLAAEAEGSVVIVQVGFSTNLARLLDSPGDDVSPLNGKDLVKAKVKLLSVMAGYFKKVSGDEKPHREYNVVEDIPSAKKLVETCPVPIVFSGFEIGQAIGYPSESILRDYDYVPYHIVKEGYIRYEPPPHNRPTWDLTSVLYAVFPDRGYFGVSEPHRVQVTDEGITAFTPDPDGLHRFLTVTHEQVLRITEAFVHLCSQPPKKE